MPPNKAKKIPEQDWQTHQPALKHLWLVEKREMLGDEGVVETMKARYGFSASRSQYEARFKKWKWSKNQKKEVWEVVSAVIQERERQGRKSEVYMQGKLQTPEKVRKETLRYSLSIPQRLAFSSTPQLPESIAIRSPLLGKAASMAWELPFRVFEDSLLLGSDRARHQMPAWPNLPQSIDPRLTVSGGSYSEPWNSADSMLGFETRDQQPSIDATRTVGTASDTWTPGSSTFTALDTALKSVWQPIADEDIAGSSAILPGTQVFTSPLHRLILFSVANNFAGISVLPIRDVIHFLQKETNQNLYELIRLAPGYTSRAIGQNLFKGAIEAGDARIVDLLLSENFADIDINHQISFVEGERYTPVERATILQHNDLIFCLLRHGAYVNVKKDFDSTGSHSEGTEPLSLLDRYMQATPFQHDTELDPQIMRILLEAGCDLSEYSIRILVEHKYEDVVRLHFSANAHKNIAKWSKLGVFLAAVKLLDNETSMDIIKIMLKVGADPNYHVKCHVHHQCHVHHVHGTDPSRLIDAAAQRGHFEVVTLLMSHGALLTSDTLPCAIASGNEDLVQFLLKNGADINSIGRLKITPLAAAIQLQNARVIKMIEGQGALARLDDEVHFSAALRAASGVGDIPLMEYLMQARGNVPPGSLSFALRVATRHGMDEVARILIDAGADVNTCDHENGKPLSNALRRRNADLVHLILDADANVDYRTVVDCCYGVDCCLGADESVIVLAAQWGDHSVVKTLILAGADSNSRHHRGNERGFDTALAIAVKGQDRVLVQLLLDSGADVNNGKSSIYIDSRHSGGSALEAAAENGDVSMARYLFDQGADPDDPAALEKAASLQSAELFELVLEDYKKRYPRGRRGFGSSVLSQAIKKGNGPAISRMLERGLDASCMIFIRSIFVTPFGHAILEEHVEIAESVELFLLKGCNPNSVVSQTCDRVGLSPPIRVTALLAAIGTRNVSKIELLIRYGADVNFPTSGPIKRTPLQRAAEIGSIEIVELLVHNGAEVNAPAAQRSGATALQLAAIGGYIPTACALLNLKADVDAPSSKVNGRTALEGAAEHGRLDMVKLLLNAGAGSKGKDHAQFARAIELAKENGFSYICDLLKAHLHLEEHGNGLDMLADINGDDFMNWDLNEGGSPS